MTDPRPDAATHPVTVIGVGADGRLAHPLPADVTLVAGGRRHLAAHAPAGVATVPLAGDLHTALTRVAAVDGPVAVLASGDPGWFGIVRRLAAVVDPARLVVHPAASSVAHAFARIGASWEDAVVVSAHGRGVRAAVAAALAHPTVAVLTAPDAPPSAVAGALRAAGCPARRVVVAARLGAPDEHVHTTDLAGAADLTAVDPHVLLLRDPAATPTGATGDSSTVTGPTVVGHARPARPWARPAEWYAHRDGQVSKPAVRALALGHLAPAPGRLLWDVGCGSGSVAVEAAGLGAGVVAVDRDPVQRDRTQANAAAAGVSLGTVAGEAPAALALLPDPDAVFVGGAGSGLPAVLAAVAARGPDRVAVALATLERVAPAQEALRGAGYAVRAELVQVSAFHPLGDGHRLAPQNPVALVLAEREGAPS